MPPHPAAAKKERVGPLPQKITEVRAHVFRGGRGDYHDQDREHSIVGQISTFMPRHPEFRATRKSWGIDVLGTLVVEVEEDDAVGFGVSAGGFPAAWMVANHLSRFLLGRRPDQTELT